MQNDDSSLGFLRERFKWFYERNHVEPPDRFGRREYAFVFFGGRGMVRHLGFNKRKKLDDFITEKNPAHCYYSTAFYEKPDRPTMSEKGWMGAELIFDLDSDHLPDAGMYGYEDQLQFVKNEFVKLVNDFLIEDFGFEEKYLDLYFSGHRGYHCHVKDPRVFPLDGNERREIVDYITGRDLIDSIIFHERSTEIRMYGKKRFASVKTLKMPKPTWGGWKGRISRGIIEIIDDVVGSEDPVEKLLGYGVKKKDAERLAKDLSSDRVNRIREGNLDQSRAIRRFFLNNVLRKKAVSIAAGETDEPVTCDIKRLIRLPGSLHGKTGFRVTKVTLKELEEFNPLNDAVVFSDEKVEVQLNQSLSIQMLNTDFNLDRGRNKVPEFLAVYLVGKNIARVID